MQKRKTQPNCRQKTTFRSNHPNGAGAICPSLSYGISRSQTRWCDFKTGRNKLPVELKSVRRNITLSPALDREAEKWKERTGMTFSAWVELKMLEVIHTETV